MPTNRKESDSSLERKLVNFISKPVVCKVCVPGLFYTYVRWILLYDNMECVNEETFVMYSIMFTQFSRILFWLAGWE